MGLKDFFANLGKRHEIAEENKDKEKPGKFCDKECGVSHENCKECLAAQEKFQIALYDLEKIERALDKSEEEIQKMAAGPSITKCPKCGAPYDSDSLKCPYCGNKYPIEQSDLEIPLSVSDRVRLYTDKIYAAWKAMNEKRTIQARLDRGVYNIGFFNKLAEFGEKIGLGTKDVLKEKPADIENAAINYYGVPVSVYISGVASGDYKIPKELGLKGYGKSNLSSLTQGNNGEDGEEE